MNQMTADHASVFAAGIKTGAPQPTTNRSIVIERDSQKFVARQMATGLVGARINAWDSEG
jgi:hypothetical protein